MTAPDRNVLPFTLRPFPRGPETPTPSASIAAPPRVLIIDDTPEDRMVVRFALEAQGFLLSEADNGERGLTAAAALQPDCILLDYRMPDLDGLEVLNAMRQPDGRLPYPVVMLTASSTAATAASLLKAGALDYLNKQNLNEDSLRRAVQGAVERFKLMEERRRAEERNAQLGAIVMASSDAILSLSLDGIVRTWNPGAMRLFGYIEAEAIGHSIDALIVPPDKRAERARISEAAATGRHAVLAESVCRTQNGRRVPVEIHVAPMLNSEGRVVATSVIMRDITERKRAEEHIKLLVNEITHRAKNLLAVVQAVARQSANLSSPEDFAERFSERITALAASHELLVESDWKGVAVPSLVRSQLAHFNELLDGRIDLRGPDLVVSATAAQAIGMMLHELATNAAKYGALSTGEGRLEVAWELTGAADDQRFEMRWHERDGPRVVPPTRLGFGSTVIRTMAEMSLDADVVLDYAPAGFIWRIECPVSRVLEK